MSDKTNIIKHVPISIDLKEALREKFEEEAGTKDFDSWVSETTGLESGTTYTLEFHETESGDTCIKIPDELIKALGWELDDDIVFEEIGDDGEFTLQNISKQFRDATKAWKNATSIDME